MNCLLIAEPDSMLAYAITMILGKDEQINLIKSSARTTDLLEVDIHRYDAQILIFDSEIKMTKRVMIVDLLFSHPTLKIILIDKESNAIEVIHKQEIHLKKPDDLVETIRAVRSLPEEDGVISREWNIDL